MTGGSAEIQSGSSYTQLHHIGSYPSPVQQVYHPQHVGIQQIHHSNPVYQPNPNLVHQVNSTHQISPALDPVQRGNPAYQVNPGQFTRHLHHYDPTHVNTSYSHSSSYHQMEHLHAAHLHPAHHYGNSGFSFKR